MKTKDIIYSGGIHAATLLEEVKSYSPDDSTVEELANYLNSVKMKDTETLYNRMFQDLMRKSQEYFRKLSWKAAAVLMMKFVEIIISSQNQNEITDAITTKNLSEKEVAGMQYLAGYVLRKIFLNSEAIPAKKKSKLWQ